MFISKKELQRRLGSAYGSGYSDGAYRTPFWAGYWIKTPAGEENAKRWIELVRRDDEEERRKK